MVLGRSNSLRNKTLKGLKRTLVLSTLRAKKTWSTSAWQHWSIACATQIHPRHSGERDIDNIRSGAIAVDRARGTAVGCTIIAPFRLPKIVSMLAKVWRTLQIEIAVDAKKPIAAGLLCVDTVAVLALEPPFVRKVPDQAAFFGRRWRFQDVNISECPGRDAVCLEVKEGRA